MDDLCLIHPKSWAPKVRDHLRWCYPAHLPFEVQHFNKQGGIYFLDVFIICLRDELCYCTNSKQTNFGVYMPWRSNNPRVGLKVSVPTI